MAEKIGFSVIYHHPDDKKKFDERYQKHLIVFEEQMGNIVESVEVLKVDDKVFYQQAIVKFDIGTNYDKVMESSEMKVVVDDVLDFVPEGKFQFIPIIKTLYE